MDLLPADTTLGERVRSAAVVLLPVGSLEQHGPHLPLTTDTVVAAVLAAEIEGAHPVRRLPPLTFSCSHEHAAWPGTVSLSAATLIAVVTDVAASLHAAGAASLVLVNGHGGNYVLGNVVQEAGVRGPLPMALFPAEADWEEARTAAGLATTGAVDMHAGELETSVLLHARPDLVGDLGPELDHTADDRRDLLRHGMGAYTASGIVGRPSLATPEKGRGVLASLVTAFARLL